MQFGFNHINKFNFLKAYPNARTEVFRLENIQNSFAAAGLVPLYLEYMLSQLNI